LTGERDDTPITHLHIHDALEIGYCLEGSGICYIGAKILPFSQGDVTIITDREFHRCRSSPGTRSRWAWFFVHPQALLVPHATPVLTWESERFCGQDFNNIISPSRSPRIPHLVLQLFEEARLADVVVRANLRALMLLIINELHRTFPKRALVGKSDHGALALSRITPALLQIVSYFDSPLTIPDLAHSCGMSVRNFQLQFTKLMGVTPQGHLLKSRVQAAAAMLGDHHRSITNIAYACGFNTLSAFNRAFKTFYHCNPRAYRVQFNGHSQIPPAATSK
jgi:AraC-like DNA-binding protein